MSDLTLQNGTASNFTEMNLQGDVSQFSIQN